MPHTRRVRLCMYISELSLNMLYIRMTYQAKNFTPNVKLTEGFNRRHCCILTALLICIDLVKAPVAAQLVNKSPAYNVLCSHNSSTMITCTANSK